MKAVLVLEDGTVFVGKSFGAQGESTGEVIFNTAMIGYQEVLSDAANCGHIVVMTYPLIGNYGINEDALKDKNSKVKGFIVKEKTDVPSNWRSKEALDTYMARDGVIGLYDIDTRALTKKIRNSGTMKGIIASEPFNIDELKAKITEVSISSGLDLVSQVTTKKAYNVGGDGPKVAVIDFGSAEAVIPSLKNRGCEIEILPAGIDAKTILELNPTGVVLSDGPGNPVDLQEAIKTVKELGKHKPIFGISLGHQILALSLGAKVDKLKFGHRGSQPVKDLKNDHVFITTQNHGYVVSKEGLDKVQLTVTHINVNDKTIEGLEHNELPLFSIQYLPDEFDVKQDSKELFDKFYSLLEK